MTPISDKVKTKSELLPLHQDMTEHKLDEIAQDYYMLVALLVRCLRNGDIDCISKILGHLQGEAKAALLQAEALTGLRWQYL